MEVRGQLVGVRSQGLRVQALMLGSRLLYPEPSLAPEPAQWHTLVTQHLEDKGRAESNDTQQNPVRKQSELAVC